MPHCQDDNKEEDGQTLEISDYEKDFTNPNLYGIGRNMLVLGVDGSKTNGGCWE